MQAAKAHDALAMISYEGKPSAFLLADNPAAADRLADAAELAGCRVLGRVRFGDAVEQLADAPAFEVLVAEVEQDHGPRLDKNLALLGRLARSGKAVVVTAAPAMIDAVAAQAWDVIQLSDPSEEQLVEAIAEAAQHRTARLHDIGKGELRQLSQDAARIASALASLSETADRPEEGDAALIENGQIDAAKIRSIIRARRLRDQFFPPDLFADPAWDMLLDLMAARLDAQHVAVSSLCIAAAVPATTALRWIKSLTEQGLFVRTSDPTDGRRVYIELSDGAAAALLDYLKAVQRLATHAL
jgi:hypothetical protein